MALKKRKTPINQLFPEREALRVRPISKNKRIKHESTNGNSRNRNIKRT